MWRRPSSPACRRRPVRGSAGRAERRRGRPGPADRCVPVQLDRDGAGRLRAARDERQHAEIHTERVRIVYRNAGRDRFQWWRSGAGRHHVQRRPRHADVDSSDHGRHRGQRLDLDGPPDGRARQRSGQRRGGAEHDYLHLDGEPNTSLVEQQRRELHIHRQRDHILQRDADGHRRRRRPSRPSRPSWCTAQGPQRR